VTAVFVVSGFLYGSFASRIPALRDRLELSDVGTSAATAGLGIAAFNVTMVVGRLSGDRLVERLAPDGLVRAGAAIAGLGFAFALTAGGTVPTLAGFAALGAGNSTVVPIVFRAAGDAPGVNPGIALAAVSTIGYSAARASRPRGATASWYRPEAEPAARCRLRWEPMSARVALTSLLAAAALAGCGDDRPPAIAPSTDPQQEIAHIHGLGINPADESLVLATHTGLFRAPAGSDRARRVGDRRQDTMGFTVVGPDRFLGSGHPDARDDLPPLLGLIRSNDGGREWTPVSLLGEADFHVLRASGARIYGVDSASGALFVSSNGGADWRRREPPGALLDVAIDPADPDRIVASGERGLLLSRDAGASWRPLSTRVAGLLAWADSLIVVDGGGGVFEAAEPLARLERIGQVEGRPAALAVHDGQLLLATHDNRVLVSDDGGRSWRKRLSG
jgi:hypothetical protein